MILIIIAVVVVGIALVARASWWLVSARSETRSLDHYGDAMQSLRTFPERLLSSEQRRPIVPAVQPNETEPGLSPPTPERLLSGPSGSRGPHSWASEASSASAQVDGRSIPPAADRPSAARTAAQVIGLGDPPGGRDPAVEANARLTGSTGLVLIALLFVEGLTIPFIGRLVSWHILIGLILVPPLMVKMGSVLWRFSRYYLNDPAFRRAGPPHPLLRVLGPLVMISTIVLFGSGIALWLIGPTDRTMFQLHQLSFVLWFIAVAAHVVAHLLRATRLAAADARDARGGRGVGARQRRRARGRRGLIAVSLVAGLLLGLAARSVSSYWTNGRTDRPAIHASSSSAVHRS